MILKYTQNTIPKYLFFKSHTSLPLAGVPSGVAASEAAVAVALTAALGLGVTGTIFSHSEILPSTFRNCGWFTQVLYHLVTFTNDFLSAGSNAFKGNEHTNNQEAIIFWQQLQQMK